MAQLTRAQWEELCDFYADGAEVNHLFDKAFIFGIEYTAELHRLAPMEARIKELEGALSLIASCEVKFDGDVVSIARKTLGEKA